MGRVSNRHRAQVLLRDGHRCAAEGILPGRCGGHLDIGHIVGRGMGGTPEGSVYDTPAWTVLHCRRHNDAMESDAETRATAEANGHRVSKRAPKLMPDKALVHYPDGWFWLNDDDPATRTPLVVTNAWQAPHE